MRGVLSHDASAALPLVEWLPGSTDPFQDERPSRMPRSPQSRQTRAAAIYVVVCPLQRMGTRACGLSAGSLL